MHLSVERPQLERPHPDPEALAAERRHQAWQLRVAGASIRAIARALGVSVGTAHGYISETARDLARDTRALAEQARCLQLERLDGLLRSVSERATNKNAPDQDAAIASMLRILERQSRLLGLDAPTRVSHEGEGGGPVQINSQVSGTLDVRATLTPDEALRLAQTLQQKIVLLAKNTERYGPKQLPASGEGGDV